MFIDNIGQDDDENERDLEKLSKQIIIGNSLFVKDEKWYLYTNKC